MKKNVRLFLSIIIVVSVMINVVGCGSKEQESKALAQTESSSQKNTSSEQNNNENTEQKVYKIGYISKMLTHPWFIQEDWGLAKKAEELGLEYVSIDADLDDEKCLSAVDNLIAQGIHGLAICATNQGLGPAISRKCAEAGVILCTIDDSMLDHEGAQLPHVGMPTREVGILGGEALGEIALDRGFFSEGNVVKVMQVDVPNVSVIHDRVLGYQEGLLNKVDVLTEEDFVVQGSKDGMFEDSLNVASSMLNANPEVTHWIVTGANDDMALAPLKIFQEAGFNMDNVIACGLGGYELSLEEFKKGNKSYICIALQPDVEGMKAVEMMYDNLVNGTEMPENTFVSGTIATVDNWLDIYPNGQPIYLQGE